MELSKRLLFHLDGVAVELRSLRAGDVGEAYVQALRRQRAFLENNPEDPTLASQRAYVEEIVSSDSRAIAGLFVAGELVATAGMQNIVEADPATIGIFILDPALRGHGYGKALVWCSCELLHACVGVMRFGAGMNKANVPSLRAFTAAGFSVVRETQEDVRVEAQFEQLVRPGRIRDGFLVDDNAVS